MKIAQTLKETEKSLKLGMDMTIREALRVMIDNRRYATRVTDCDETIAVITVGELREAMRQGINSSTTLQQLLLGKLFKEIFFKQDGKK